MKQNQANLQNKNQKISHKNQIIFFFQLKKAYLTLLSFNSKITLDA